MRFGLFVCLIVCLGFVSQDVDAQDRAATGSKAPGFTLTDQHGKSQSLEGLLKDRNVALVFHRSADW